MIKFNTAYYIAKEELLFTTFTSQIILMKKNWLNVKPTYSNKTACCQFIGVISEKSVQIADSTYMSYMSDGDTGISTK